MERSTSMAIDQMLVDTELRRPISAQYPAAFPTPPSFSISSRPSGMMDELKADEPPAKKPRLEMQQDQRPTIVHQHPAPEAAAVLSEADFQEALIRLSAALPIERMTPAQLLRAQQQIASFLGNMSEQLQKKMTK